MDVENHDTGAAMANAMDLAYLSNTRGGISNRMGNLCRLWIMVVDPGDMGSKSRSKSRENKDQENHMDSRLPHVHTDDSSSNLVHVAMDGTMVYYFIIC